jgi:hypothetical protein
MMNASTFPLAHLSPCVKVFIESLIAEVDEATAHSLFRSRVQPPGRTPFVQLRQAKLGVRKHVEDEVRGSIGKSVLIA